MGANDTPAVSSKKLAESINKIDKERKMHTSFSEIDTQFVQATGYQTLIWLSRNNHSDLLWWLADRFELRKKHISREAIIIACQLGNIEVLRKMLYILQSVEIDGKLNIVLLCM